MTNKAIFLDIDGVLNCYSHNPLYRSKSRCGACIGIDKDKTQKLSKIIKSTKADLILSSSWKVGWEPYHNYTEPHAKYLDNHLRKKGNLFCKDKTREKNLWERGLGIKAYLIQHPEYTNWIILDDELFKDFITYNMLSHFLKVNHEYGLTDKDVEIAIKMLNGELIGPYGLDEYDNEIVSEKTAGPSNTKGKGI